MRLFCRQNSSITEGVVKKFIFSAWFFFCRILFLACNFKIGFCVVVVMHICTSSTQGSFTLFHSQPTCSNEMQEAIKTHLDTLLTYQYAEGVITSRIKRLFSIRGYSFCFIFCCPIQNYPMKIMSKLCQQFFFCLNMNIVPTNAAPVGWMKVNSYCKPHL